MNIVFSINRKFLQQLCTTIVSVLENNFCNINIIILHSDLNEKDISIIELLKLKYKNLKIEYINVDKKHFENLKNNIEYISIETYYRYAIAEFITEEKCLYLDADIIVNGNLENLYNTDIEDFYCAGVKDLFIECQDYKKTIDLSEQNIYINAGVLLLNLKKMKEDNIYKLLLDNTENYQDKIKFQDQDIINITFKNKIKEVDSINNFTSMSIEFEKEKSKNAVIIHYTGAKKPWHFKYKDKFYKKIWQKYNKIYKLLILQKKRFFEWFKFLL